MSAPTYSKRKDDVVIGRPPIHEERKKTHNITVTPTGWRGLQELAERVGCSSVSDLAEKIGRRELPVGHQGQDSSISKLSTASEDKHSLEKMLEQNNETLKKELKDEVISEVWEELKKKITQITE